MYEALTWIAERLFDIEIRIALTAANINGVYLIGSYLSQPLFQVAQQIVGLISRVLHFRNQLQEFTDSVGGGGGDSGIIRELVYWARRLIAFIADPFPVIVSVVRSAFGFVEYMYYNAYQFIYPHVLAFLDGNLPWWRSLSATVLNYLSGWIPDFSTLRANPVRWVFDRLRSYSGALSAFLADPDGWIKERVRVYFPALWALVQDPAGYIIDRLGDKLEIFADRYMSRIIKVAEHILNLIF